MKGLLIKVQGNLARVMILLRQCKIPLNLSGSEGVRTKQEWFLCPYSERRGDLCEEGALRGAAIIKDTAKDGDYTGGESGY